MEVYAPYSDQPKLDRSREELPEAEQIIYDHFNKPEFVEKLVNFLSLEDKKGRDKFNTKRFMVFKVDMSEQCFLGDQSCLLGDQFFFARLFILKSLLIYKLLSFYDGEFDKNLKRHVCLMYPV